MPLMNDDDFDQWCQQSQLPDATIEVIKRIRSSPPARNVQGGRSNVTSRVPVHSMGFTIQTESRTNEKPGMRVFYEYDSFVRENAPDEVIEFYDQPDRIQLKYLSPKQRQVNTSHTADFFVIRKDSAGWEEWKTDAHLEKLAEKQPNRYVKDPETGWRCPPGEAYAAQFGLYYRVRVQSEIDWAIYSNLEFLHEYFVRPDIKIARDMQDAVRDIVSRDQGLSIRTLLAQDGVEADVVYQMIALKTLYIDLAAGRLADINNGRDVVKIYTSRSAANATNNLALHNTDYIKPATILLDPGAPLQWDGEAWTMLNRGINTVSLQHVTSKRITELPNADFEALLRNHRILGQPRDEEASRTFPEVQAIWERATDEDYAIANLRLKVLDALENGQTIEEAWASPEVRDGLGEPRSDRTIREWKKAYHQAEVNWGNGYIGLIPETRSRGNRSAKTSDQTREFTETFISHHLEDLRQPNTRSVWVQYQEACVAQSIEPVSLATFGKMAKARPLEERTRKRKGRRAANQVKPRYWHLDRSTPRHGERPWHIVHIDHTRLDIELVHSVTGKNLGRPWLTFCVDARTRRTFAAIATLDDNPSYRTCVLVGREVVRRFNRLPQIIYVDNGKEFRSTYFQTLSAWYNVELAYRPPGEPRFGDVSERLFNTTNVQFIYNLMGNTQIMKEVRSVTKSNNPKNLAIWTFPELCTALQDWTYEVYDQTEHFSLLETPREAYEREMVLSGPRTEQTWIDYDEFVKNALPTPRRGLTRKVTQDGIQHDNLAYWHDEMLHPDVMGHNVKVRYDPFNVGIIYAYIRGRWVRCQSEYFVHFNGMTEMELAMIKEELKASFRRHSRVQRTINAKMLADFMNSVQATEARLVRQMKDAEARLALSMTDTDSVPDDELSARRQRLEKPETPANGGGLEQSLTCRQPDQDNEFRPIKSGKYDHLELPDDL